MLTLEFITEMRQRYAQRCQRAMEQDAKDINLPEFSPPSGEGSTSEGKSYLVVATKGGRNFTFCLWRIGKGFVSFRKYMVTQSLSRFEGKRLLVLQEVSIKAEK